MKWIEIFQETTGTKNRLNDLGVYLLRLMIQWLDEVDLEYVSFYLNNYVNNFA